MRRMAMLLMVMLVTMSATAAQPLLARNQHSTINNRQSFDLQAAIAAAKDGDTITVPGGTYPGPIVIDKSVKLIGKKIARS